MIYATGGGFQDIVGWEMLRILAVCYDCVYLSDELVRELHENACWMLVLSILATGISFAE